MENQSEIDRFLRLLKTALLSRPNGSSPHPNDLAVEISKFGVKLSADDLLKIIRNDIESKGKSKTAPVFSLVSSFGFTSIQLSSRSQNPPRLKDDFAQIRDESASQSKHTELNNPKRKSGSSSTRASLGKQDILAMNPYDFEKLVESILRHMGLSQLAPTQKSRDNGIDIRGTLIIKDVIKIKIVVQVKRYTGSVSAPEIQKFRGSLSHGAL